MPNPVPRKYTVQLAPTFTPDIAGELAAWAEVCGRSISEVTREAAEFGLRQLREKWSADHGGRRPDPVKLAKHIEAAAERGERQAARRQRHDRATRGGARTSA
jgi:hypothetical protein